MDTRNIHVEPLDRERFMLMPLSTAHSTSVRWFHDEACRIQTQDATCTCTKEAANER